MLKRKLLPPAEIHWTGYDWFSICNVSTFLLCYNHLKFWNQCNTASYIYHSFGFSEWLQVHCIHIRIIIIIIYSSCLWSRSWTPCCDDVYLLLLLAKTSTPTQSVSFKLIIITYQWAMVDDRDSAGMITAKEGEKQEMPERNAWCAGFKIKRSD